MKHERVGQEIRSQHRWAYRPGQWALITGVAEVRINADITRNCYQLRWPDGKTDDWAINDPMADYEYREHKESN